MRSLTIALLPAFAAAATKIAKVDPKPKVNGTVEYSSQCKTCPYNLCTNVNTPYGGDNVTLTCWADGDKVGDTKLWLKTTDNCYITEYDLDEYTGDFSADLPSCGRVPLKITKQDNKVRYLSECKWTSSTSSESIKFYGRDQDVTLTCFVPDGSNILNNTNWYKTTDNCHVSATGLWKIPNNAKLDNCGPDPYPRANETKRSLDEFTIKTKKSIKAKKSLLRRWLEPGLIGEEYAPCLSCPSKTANETCKRVENYEYNQTVISQCFKEQLVNYPNGTTGIDWFMLTTDWCYVDPDNFWEPPYDNYRYPTCDDFPGNW